MKLGSGIFGVYAPVLLAAVLIMTVAPGCLMPSCGFVRGGAVTACTPQPQQFTPACGLDGAHAPASAPCSGGDCDDSTMSHGSPDAIAAQGMELPAPVAALVPQAPEISVVALLGHDAGPVLLPDFHPPDPLGVRLSI